MPNHAGPNINESGLVFSFDVNDYNSFKGQPGTNLGSGPNFGYTGSGYTEYQNGKLIRWKSINEKVHIPTLGVKNVNTIEWYNVYSGYGVDGNYTCCPTIFTYSPNGWNSTILEPSTEYMYQIIYKSASGYTHPNYMYHYERSADDSQGTEFGVHSTGRRTHLGDGWYHAWGSFTTQSYTVKGYFGCWHYEYNTKNKVSLAAVSLVKGNTIRPPAQFIDEGATLGNTEALLDLKGNSTIDLTNVSFDSNAQMIFDGTSDYITVPHNAAHSFTGDFSIEIVFKPTGNTANCLIQKGSGNDYYQEYWVICDTRGSNRSFALIMGKVGNTSANYNVNASNSVTIGQYHHIVTGVQGNTGFLYVNGELIDTGDVTDRIQSTSDIRIGERVDGFADSLGYQPLTKIYNRALTASEVQSNYNAIKGRFNI